MACVPRVNRASSTRRRPRCHRGAGTIGDEIICQSHDLDVVAVPVGGGGLIAGVGSYIKAVKPEVRVIGVEPVESDALYRSLAVGRRIVLDRVGIFVEVDPILWTAQRPS